MTKNVALQSAWTLVDALDFLRGLQARVEPIGYHVGLLGSVLLKGESLNDLDILIYPASTEKKSHGRLFDVFIGYNMTLVIDVQDVQAKWRRDGSQDTKQVSVWSWGGRSVDVFFLS